MLAVHAELVAGGAIERLAMDDAETRLWMDCELASLVENRFFARVDPASRGAELRDVWEPRATRDGAQLGTPHAGARYVVPYWLTQGGCRVGTVALSTGRKRGRNSFRQRRPGASAEWANARIRLPIHPIGVARPGFDRETRDAAGRPNVPSRG